MVSSYLEPKKIAYQLIEMSIILSIVISILEKAESRLTASRVAILIVQPACSRLQERVSGSLTSRAILSSAYAALDVMEDGKRSALTAILSAVKLAISSRYFLSKSSFALAASSSTPWPCFEMLRNVLITPPKKNLPLRSCSAWSLERVVSS